MEVEVENIINDDALAPMRTKMRKKLMDTLLLGASEDDDRVCESYHSITVEVCTMCLRLDRYVISRG